MEHEKRSRAQSTTECLGDYDDDDDDDDGRRGNGLILLPTAVGGSVGFLRMTFH